MVSAIETQGLTKRYGTTTALDGLTLTIEPGEIFGFLGPNGAGKSTTIRLLLDLIRPTAGVAHVMGFDCRHQSHEVRARIGYLPGDLRLYHAYTGHETLAYFGRMRGMATVDAATLSLAERLEFDVTRKAGAYSKGNRQKLGILLAFLGRPPVLLLDEPTSGLDPLVQHTVWTALREIAAEGTAVFFSSHVMSEVEQVCDRVGILREGKLVDVESVSHMKARAFRHVEVTFAGEMPGVLDSPTVREIRREGPVLEYEVTGEIDPLLKAIAPFHVLDLRTEQPTLDEVLMGYYRGDGA
ncbi:MAG: ABC transporter ATP-binding protein [Dehalococcoidia bacterium]